MEIVSQNTPMREIEIFGIPALFTAEDIPPDTEIPGMYAYELLNPNVSGTVIGNVFTLIPVPVPESGERDVFDGDLVIDTEGKYLTPLEFGEKYLSPNYGQDAAVRYGKTD